MKLKDTLEDKIEYSNATQFRKSFLGVVDKLQDNMYLRYVVTKHGEPRAVVMSFAAYDMMRRGMQQVIALENQHSPAEAARAAFMQMSRDARGSMRHADAASGYGGAPLSVLTERLDDLAQQVSKLRNHVEHGIPQRPSGPKHGRKSGRLRGASMG
jgi:prevent-host-death family protein